MFRVLGEGLPVVLPYVEPGWILDGDVKALRVLVERYYPLCESFAEPFRERVEARGQSSPMQRRLDIHVLWQSLAVTSFAYGPGRTKVSRKCCLYRSVTFAHPRVV